MPRLRSVTAVTGWNNLSASRCFTLVNMHHFRCRLRASGPVINLCRGSLETIRPLFSFDYLRHPSAHPGPGYARHTGRSKTDLQDTVQAEVFGPGAAMAVTPDGCWHVTSWPETLNVWRSGNGGDAGRLLAQPLVVERDDLGLSRQWR